MNDSPNTSGAIFPGALGHGHVLPTHHASTAVPTEFLKPFFRRSSCASLAPRASSTASLWARPFLVLASTLPASATHCDSDGLRHMPVMTGASALSEMASQ